MYDFKEIESDILKLWSSKKIFKKAMEKNKDGKPFYFCDGPPYATGSIHPGTGWNKVIKDSVCRYWRMKGFNVRAQAGYDTHGLPIEVKVEQEMKIKNKHEIEDKVGIEKFIKHCKDFATKYIEKMGGQFESLGVWLDFENPYITYRDSYIESSWKTLKMAWEKQLMKEDVYSLAYCYRCETTMANYELEYDEETDPSIFVKFKVKDKDEYLIIWTTTPWTLIANIGVMAHPTYKYVKAKVGDEVWILAKERLDYLMELIGENATVLEEFSGKKLEGTRYEHPFQDKIKKEYDRRVVLSDEYVSLEEGTGLVHTAPGHGHEDFIIGKRFDLDIFCPVDEKGQFTEDGGMFEGKNVRAANPEVIELLDNIGALVREERIKHRYPHCWRCKTPLIFVTTKQWFITVSDLKGKMMDEIEKVEWHPDFAKQRFKEFVTNAPDWCISRQRYWGIPLPIWKCKCGEIKVVGSKEEIPEVKELHRPYIDKIELDCKCGEKMHRVKDVLDVWFDSGNAVWASMTPEDIEKFGEKTDVIIEGQDQIRGWFYSLLGSGVVRYDACPYKRLLMHGFFVDEKGEKMSKSVGNFIPLEEITEKYGADSFRMWGISSTIWDEQKFNWDELKKANGDLNIVYNLMVFLQRFHPKKKIEKPVLKAEDVWILSRVNSTIKEFHRAFENYELHQGTRVLRNFIVEDLSRFYMKMAKDRISRGKDSDAALYAIYTSMLKCIKMLSVVSPMLSEYVYQQFFKKFEDAESVSLLELDLPEESDISLSHEKQMELVKEIASVALTVRQDAEIKLRWPIRTLYIETKSREVEDALSNFSETLANMLNAKGVEIVEKKPSGKISSGEFSAGKIFIDKTIDEELYEEGMNNEVKRRVQNLRKKEKLLEKNKVTVYISTEKEIENMLGKNIKKLMKEVNAGEVKFAELKNMEEYKIDGRIVKIKIKSS